MSAWELDERKMNMNAPHREIVFYLVFLNGNCNTERMNVK